MKTIVNSTLLRWLLCFVLHILFVHDIQACANLNPRINVSTSGSCIPKQVSVQNNSTGSSAASSIYELYVNGGLIDTAHGTSKTFNFSLNRGQYTIKLLAIDASGCKDSTQTNINITKPLPRFLDYQSSFSDTPRFVNCIQLSTDPDSFTLNTRNEDTLNALTINWGDGQSATFGNLPEDSTFTHTYTSSGIFNLTFRTTDTAGCTETVVGEVTNERVPTAGIIGPNSGFNLGCAPFSVTFVNNSKNISNGTTFTWNMGDGTSITKANTTFKDSLTHEYKSTLCNATVQLIASNACGFSQTTWNPIQISNKDKALFSIDNTNCDSTGFIRFINRSTDSFCIFPDTKRYYWDFGDGTNSGWISSKGVQLHNYKDQGPKTVCLIAQNGCGNDTTCIPTTVVYTPVVGFEYDTLSGCESVTVNINDTSRGYDLTRLWSFGDGTTSTAKQVSHTYTQPGTYNLRLSVGNRCGTQTRNETIIIRRKPRASFTGLTNGCIVHSVSPTNTSQSDFAQTDYHWTFGNGDTSILANPSGIQYPDSGTYNIRLIATDTCGADTAYGVVRVDRLPTIQLTADSAFCSLDTVHFTNTSSDYDFLIVNYGDGSTQDSIFANGTFFHTYTVSGIYDITVRAVNNGICESYDTLTVIIKPNSVARFDLNDTAACAPFTFTMTNQSQYASSYQWFVDDTLRSTADTLAPIAITSDTTIRHIRLVAIDTIGCLTDTLERTIFSAKDPVATITNPIDSGCGPLADTLLNNSQFASTYSWNLGNSVSSLTREPRVTYAPKSRGDTTYNIRLIAINWLGCRDTTHGTRKVFPIPVSDFTMDTSDGCFPVNVTFTNTSHPNGIGSRANMRFEWDFGNGTTDTVENPFGIQFQESRTQDSVFTITLSAYSQNGCPAIKRDTVTVYPKPSISFTPDQRMGCGPLTVQFGNSSLPNNFGSRGLMSFQWNLGNGQRSSSESPSATFVASQTKDSFYAVQLIGTTEHNCVDSLTQMIQVFPKPSAQFSLDTNAGCSPLVVGMSNSSAPYDTSTIDHMSFIWDFGNGDSAFSAQTSDTFYEASLKDTTYRVQLIALSEHGCADTLSDQVTVHPTPTSAFVPDRIDGCGPLRVEFTNQSQLNDTSFWDLGSGFAMGPGDTNYTYDWLRLKDTTYRIRLATKTRYNCLSDTSTHFVTVFSQPLADFVITDDSLCEYEVFEFQNQSLGADGYLWDFDDGNTDTIEHPQHQYAKGSDAYAPLDYDVQLKAISDHNCHDSTTRPAHIFPFTVATIGNSLDSFCSPATVSFTNSSTNFSNSEWWFGDGSGSTQDQPSYFYQNISNIKRPIQVVLETENESGCIDRDTLNFLVLPEPIADFSPFRRDVCDSGYHQMVNISINNEENLWDFDDGSTSTEAEPYHRFDRNTTGDAEYTIQLIVKNTSGCPDTATSTIRLNPLMTVDFDTTVISSVCIEDVIQFTNRSSYAVFHKWSFGDGAESRDSQPSYFYPNAGLYDVKYVGYDIHGCPDSIVKRAMINVLDRPSAGFTFNPKTPKMPNSLVNFTDQSSPASGLSYSWDFGDPPSTSSLQHPSHQYTDSGWYAIRLIVDNGYCRDTADDVIYISPPLPYADFTINDSSGCSPLQVQFNQTSQDATGFRWFFDDGNESTDPNPVHTFTHEGYYDITLITYGPGGQTDTTFRNLIRVYPSPTAFFTVSPTEKYLPRAEFGARNESTDATSYVWNVRNETDVVLQTSIEENPIFTLDETGQFSVDLLATNDFGCVDSFSRPMYLTVFAEGHILVPNAFTPSISPGLNDGFKPVMLSVSPEAYRFSVYNRWGEKIYETTELNGSWDGTYQGKMSEMEVYIYLVEGQFYSGEAFKKSGEVFLVK